MMYMILTEKVYFVSPNWQAYASGCDIVILLSGFTRVQIIPGSLYGYKEVHCVDCADTEGKVNTYTLPNQQAQQFYMTPCNTSTQWSTAQHSTAQHSTAQQVQHSTARHSTTQHSTAQQVQHSMARHGTTQHSTASAAQHGTLARHGTALHSTAQHSTAQHGTAQHSTAQYSTA